MPLYLVEDLQTEDQVDSFEADDLEDAIGMFLQLFEDFPNRLVGLERGGRRNAFVWIDLPYGGKYKYELGEEGY